MSDLREFAEKHRLRLRLAEDGEQGTEHEN